MIFTLVYQVENDFFSAPAIHIDRPMELENKPRKLAIVIPSGVTRTRTVGENAVNGNNGCLQSDYQIHRWTTPTKPLYHPTTMMNSKMETVAKLTSDLKAEDIGSPNLLVVTSFMSTAKEPLDFMMRAFNSLGDQVQELSSLPSEVEHAEEESHSEL